MFEVHRNVQGRPVGRVSDTYNFLTETENYQSCHCWLSYEVSNNVFVCFWWNFSIFYCQVIFLYDKTPKFFGGLFYKPDLNERSLTGDTMWQQEVTVEVNTKHSNIENLIYFPPQYSCFS